MTGIKKSRTKVKSLQLAQTPEQLAKINTQIPDIMENLVRDKIETCIKEYGRTLENRLGLTEDDLLNDIREQLWKALITYNPAGGANLSTYCRRLIENRFLVLLKQSSRHKYTVLEYFPDVYNDGLLTGFCSDFLDESSSKSKVSGASNVDENTPETLFEQRHEFMKDLAYLNDSDRILYSGIEQGYGLSELAKLTGKTVIEITAAVKRIELLVRKRREQS